MKKFLHSRYGAPKGAALIIVLALVVLATIYTASASCRFITNVQIATAGSLYKVGDSLDPLLGNLCSPADDYSFRLKVTSVNGSGGVTAVTIVPGVGIGYSSPPSNPIRFGGSPTGTGFTANCTFN
jgi:hypothetical protein